MYASLQQPRTLLVLGITAYATSLAPPAIAQEKTLPIPKTAPDIPRTIGQPHQGFEVNRYNGNPMNDA